VYPCSSLGASPPSVRWVQWDCRYGQQCGSAGSKAGSINYLRCQESPGPEAAARMTTIPENGHLSSRQNCK